MSDVTLARGSAALLWLLIFLAAMGGLAAWLRPTSKPEPAPAAGDDAGVASGQAVVAAGGFAERYVTAYLEAGNEGERLSPFLGYTPELPATARPTELSAPVRAVAIEEAADGYWSVTVAVGWTGQERFWQVAVDLRDGAPNAVGLPAAVAGPPDPERSSLDVNMSQPALDDPMVESVTGFLGAYLCGQGELDRYLSPGHSLTPADPAVCREAEVIRWGVVESDDPDTKTVVLDALFDSAADADSGFTPRVATYTLLLANRDDRWEVADLLPAPPLDEDD
ncbi:MAG TPA: conjugal transfer protein [Acidimicrobiales bacterium]